MLCKDHRLFVLVQTVGGAELLEVSEFKSATVVIPAFEIEGRIVFAELANIDPKGPLQLVVGCGNDGRILLIQSEGIHSISTLVNDGILGFGSSCEEQHLLAISKYNRLYICDLSNRTLRATITLSSCIVGITFAVDILCVLEDNSYWKISMRDYSLQQLPSLDDQSIRKESPLPSEDDDNGDVEEVDNSPDDPDDSSAVAIKVSQVMAASSHQGSSLSVAILHHQPNRTMIDKVFIYNNVIINN